MARITYAPGSIGGEMVAAAVDHIAKAQQLLARAKSLADSISAGGATPASLEGSAEFDVAATKGAAFYTALSDMKSNASAITAASIADLDMGG